MCTPAQCCLACYVGEAGIVVAPRVIKISNIASKYLCNPNYNFGPDPRLDKIKVADEDGKPITMLNKLRRDLITTVVLTAVECIPCFRIAVHAGLRDKINEQGNQASKKEELDREVFGLHLVELMHEISAMEAQHKSAEEKTE